MPRCPAGHRSAAADWCGVCGRPLDAGPPVCDVCAASLAGRFCDECGADTAVGSASARIAPDPSWFADVRRRAGERVAHLEPPSTPPWRVRLDRRRVVLGRRRSGQPAPDVDLAGDDGVSARHAALVAGEDGGWSVVDLGSRNGTTVGCTAVPPHREVPVPPGAVIRLGLWTSVRVETG